MREHMNARWLPAGALAKELGIYERWVFRQVKVLGVSSQEQPYGEITLPCYPPGTFERLAQLLSEKKDRDEYKALPEFVSIGEIAEIIGRSYGWTSETVKQLQRRPSRIEKRGAFQTYLYPRRLILRVRELLAEAPLAEFELNLGQLVEVTSFDRDWIVTRLSELGVKPRLMRSPLTGKFLWYYPKESPVILVSIKRVGPAHKGWLTAGAIEKALNKSTNWTRSRLAQPDIASQARLREDVQHVPRLHYPPSVLAKLRADVEAVAKYPKAGDHLPLYTAAKELGRSKLWVKNRLESLDLETPLRINGKGRVTPHISPKTMQVLKGTSENERGTSDL